MESQKSHWRWLLRYIQCDTSLGNVYECSGFQKKQPKHFLKKIIQWVQSMLIKSYNFLNRYRNISNIKKQNYQLPCTTNNFTVFHDYYCKPSYFSRNSDTKEELKSTIMQSVALKETFKIYPMRYLSWKRLWM